MIQCTPPPSPRRRQGIGYPQRKHKETTWLVALNDHTRFSLKEVNGTHGSSSIEDLGLGGFLSLCLFVRGYAESSAQRVCVARARVITTTHASHALQQ